MSISEEQILRDLFTRFRMGWFVDAFPSEQLMPRFDDFAQTYRKATTEVLDTHLLPNDVTVNSVAETAERDPERAAVFLQLFASSCSPEMLAMTWAMQHDTIVASVDLQFTQRKSFELNIELRVSHEDGSPLTFHSDAIFDLAVLRHFGLMKANESPVISGLFPVNYDWD